MPKFCFVSLHMLQPVRDTFTIQKRPLFITYTVSYFNCTPVPKVFPRFAGFWSKSKTVCHQLSLPCVHLLDARLYRRSFRPHTAQATQASNFHKLESVSSGYLRCHLVAPISKVSAHHLRTMVLDVKYDGSIVLNDLPQQ